MSSSPPASNSFTGTLVCFALKEEASAFLRAAKNNSGVAILITGIGKANAEKSLRQFLANNSPKLVLTCGFAGGLNPELKSGSVVFATNNPALAEKLSNAGARAAGFFCASRIATTVAEKQALRRETQADAVEMESAVIQAACAGRGILCATVRAISDPAQEDLPLDFNRLSNPDQSLDYGRLAVAIAKSPGKIPGLLRLQKNCRLGAEKLARVLEAIVT